MSLPAVDWKYKEAITINFKLTAIDSIGVYKMIGEEINWKGEELLLNDKQTLQVAEPVERLSDKGKHKGKLNSEGIRKRENWTTKQSPNDLNWSGEQE